jgi:hypothetical protein
MQTTAAASATAPRNRGRGRLGAADDIDEPASKTAAVALAGPQMLVGGRLAAHRYGGGGLVEILSY